MTISGALSNALSGLRAAGRGAELVSSNISNALTPGYGRRVLALSSSSLNGLGGVRIDGITRIEDLRLSADRRLAEAENIGAQTTAEFLQRMERLLGTPGDASALTARLSAFEGTLVTAASRPDAPERLDAAVSTAKDLITGIRNISDGIQEARTFADRTIGTQVDELNASLQQMVALNNQITAAQVQGGDYSALQDERQRVLDAIGVLVPVRSLPRDNGQIAIYSVGGAVLLDGTAGQLSFDRANVVTPYMSTTNGTLSGISLNGQPLRTGSQDGALRGGALGAQFAIRDEQAVSAQIQIDAVARDLVERFQDPAADVSLAPGDAGLFTDSGGSFDAVNEVGLSTRIELNAAVDADQGGAAWRLRDGLNAVTPGNVGDASGLQNLSAVLSAIRVPGSGSFGGAAFSAVDLLGVVTSDIGNRSIRAEQQVAFSGARLTELTERQLADGVDTDAEIQRLLQLEQAYAANARVVETVDEMMQQILRL